MFLVSFQDLVTEVQCALYLTLLEFTGNMEDESDLEGLIEQQFEALQKAFKIPHKASEARMMISKKFLTLFRAGKLGPFILDDVPDANTVSWVVKFNKIFIFTVLYVTLQLYMLAFSLPTPSLHAFFFFSFFFFLYLYLS